MSTSRRASWACAGYRYIRDARQQTSKNWGLGEASGGPYEDLDAFLRRADELAESLLAEGIDAMKILVQESVRAFYTGWYNELVTRVSRPLKGMIPAPPGPGLGCELLPEVWKRKDAVRRVSPA